MKGSSHINNWSFGERHDARRAALKTLAVAKKQNKDKKPVRIDPKTVVYR